MECVAKVKIIPERNLTNAKTFSVITLGQYSDRTQGKTLITGRPLRHKFQLSNLRLHAHGLVRWYHTALVARDFLLQLKQGRLVFHWLQANVTK